MEQYVGLDVSLKETSLCVVDQTARPSGKASVHRHLRDGDAPRAMGIGHVKNRGVISYSPRHYNDYQFF
jgi:hypothetical protein